MKTRICIASIPERHKTLLNVVESLYDQVDNITLFLNNYKIDLKDSKITTLSSLDFFDSGDLSKFFFSGNEDSEYFFTGDDDVIYPPDYISTLTEFLDTNPNSIVGVHGVLIKQPFSSYYDLTSRYTLNFQNSLQKNTIVHILGTGTIGYKSSINLKYTDFQFQNSADIWLAIFAQKNNIPMIAIKRPAFWLKEIPNDVSIWKACYTNQTTVFNTRAIQDHILKTNYPLTIQTEKIVLCIKTWNRKNYLQTCIETFIKTHDQNLNYVVIIADDGSEDGTLEYLDNLKIPFELHIIKNHHRYACGQTNTIFELLQKIIFKYAFIIDDDVIFKKHGWDTLYILGMSTYQHLCYYNTEYYTRIHKSSTQVIEKDNLDTILSVHTCMGCFFTITPEILDKVGYTDEKNFPIRGQWHIDYSIRCCRAGFNEIDNFYDVKNSEEYIDMQENIPGYKCSLDWNDNYKSTKNPMELQRRLQVINDPTRLNINIIVKKQFSFESAFDHVYVINLPNRTDRRNRITKQLNMLKISCEIVPAVKGVFLKEFYEYEKTNIFPTTISTTHEFYKADVREWKNRIGFMEQKLKRKAVCAGGYGYLKTYINILEDAIKNNYNQILVLDDDSIFHNQFHSLFQQQILNMPQWDIWNLGTLQYNWDDIVIHSNFYYSNLMNCASHALGINRKVFPLLLNYAIKMDVPFDMGALWVGQKTYISIVSYPNLVIQDSINSDINSSGKLEVELKKQNNIYRWNLADYYGQKPKPITELRFKWKI